VEYNYHRLLTHNVGSSLSQYGSSRLVSCQSQLGSSDLGEDFLQILELITANNDDIFYNLLFY